MLMIGSRYLLDTNIVSAWLEDEKVIATKMDNATGIFIPIIVVGEMYYYAQYSTKIEHNINNISKAISHYFILVIDENTCNQYGIIKASHRKKGKPIPENDIWISATALQHNLRVVTRDGHYKEVDGLSIERMVNFASYYQVNRQLSLSHCKSL